MSDCIFCKIAKKEITTEFLYEDDKVLAFKDIQPQAKVHILIIPKKHYATLNDISETDFYIFPSLFKAGRVLAEKYGIKNSGFRMVVNTNKEGGQAVYHVHFHLLGGQQLGGSLVG